MNHNRVSRLLTIGAIVFLASTSIACSRISPGYVGIQATSVGSNQGLHSGEPGPSWMFYNPFTDSVTEYPTFMQTAVWTHNVDEGHPVNEEITFSAKEQFQVAADISLAYTLDPSKAADFYRKFKMKELDGFTHGFLRNTARQAFDDVAGKYPIESIMGDNAAFLKEVRSELQKKMDAYGIRIEQFGFIGSPRPPQAIINSINAKVQATQLALQKQNEVVQAQADAQKEVAIAEGDAKATLTRADSQALANRKLSESLTPTLVQYRLIDKWNGELPSVQAGGGGFMLNLPSSK